LHVDIFDFSEKGVIRKEVFENLTEQEQRQKLIQFIFSLFPEPSKSIYRLINQNIKKGYTYLGMIRALEFFYIVKKQSKVKSKNSIGIIPYVYNDAQKYFQQLNNSIYRKYLTHYQNLEKNKTGNVETVKIKESEKNLQINMDLL